MLLQNEILEVELSSVPVFKHWHYKPTGLDIDGSNEDACLHINCKPMQWDEWDIEITKYDLGIFYSLKHRENGLKLGITITLSDSVVKFVIDNIIEGSEPVYSIELKNIPIFSFGQDFSIFRDNFHGRHWDRDMARGLWGSDYDEVSVIGAQPDPCIKPNLHACGYNGSVCCFVKTNWPILPLWTRAVESDKYKERCEAFELGVNGWNYRVRDKITGSYEVHIEFVPDLNGDGKADECEYQLAMKKLLPEPDTLYRDSIWYKVYCAAPDGTLFTTFKKALDIAENIYNLTKGRPQVMYLVGWQYDGHDTGYPAMDKLNEKLGSQEDLIYLIKTAKEKYNCSVSVHTNIDDSYPEHPQWDPSIISRDVDGSLMRWEGSSYHICHTKDVESGDVYRRINEMLSVFPINRTIHFDAYRTMNWSWDEDGFKGETEEVFCGILPIKQYMDGKGIDITTEGINGMRIEPAGIFNAFWHNSSLPLLYHNKLYGGGRGRSPLAYVAGTSINMDFNGNYLDTEEDGLSDRVAMDYMLYSFFLMHEMIEYRLKEHNRAFARYKDGVEAYGDNNSNILKVTWQDALIADNTTRFIPFKDFIYVYSTEDCSISRVLPKDWRGTALHIESLLPGKEAPCIYREDNTVTIKLSARIPAAICRE